MGAGPSTTRTFTTKQDESLIIPISFNDNLIDLLERGSNSASNAGNTKTSKEEQVLLQKRLFWEQKSSDQSNRQLDEIMQKIPKLESVSANQNAIDIKNQVLKCFKENPDAILDCPAIQKFKELERLHLEEYIKSH